jgi:CRP-like cAMP-binding protein
MDRIIQTLNKIEKLNEEEIFAIDKLRSLAKNTFLKKGQYLFKQDSVPLLSVYVVKGLFRHFITDKTGNEKIFRFYKEEDFIDDCHSFYNNAPINYSVQAIEDSELICFNFADVEHLNNDYPVFEKIGTKMMSVSMKNTEEHISILMKYNSEERYKYLLTHKPQLVQRITYLAQFLDVSRETLSRMRGKVLEDSIL